jgi:enoyl-CoA hydratase/carnithine racemase
MTLASRLITFPVPTVAAIGGHGFGAGFMIALCHDTRVMRRDRGYLCANEIELGMAIPEPELALFRHKMTLPAFLETVQFARRWTAPDAHAAGFVQHVADADELVEQAMSVAARQARLGANRKVFGWMKEHIHGENAAISGPHGAAYMLAHPHEFSHGPGRG